jgi:anaerobic selenocysteine-containing dehydrogenase
MTTKHYRSCNLCEAICGVVVETEGSQVVSIRGDSQDPFSRGHICPKATALGDIYHDPDRLRRPLKRDGDSWTEMGWTEAFDLVGSELRAIRSKHGPDAIGGYQGNPTVHNLGLLTFGQALFRRLGTRNLYSATSSDQLPHMLSSLLMFGHQLLLPVPDIDRTEHFVLFGANPMVSNGSLMTAPGIKRRLRRIRERGGRVVVIDPRRSETAAVADEHLFVKPGTDALLLLAMLNVLCSEGLVDFGRLASHVRDEDRVRAVAAKFPPQRVASTVGIRAETIERLARDLAAAGSAVCYGRMGVSTQQFGGLCSWLINILNLVTANFDEPGGAMFTTPAVDLPALAARAGLSGSFDRYQSRQESLPEFGGELPVSALASEIETPGSRQIRALIVSAGNPVLSTPNGARLDRALESLEFMVSIDFYLNETSRHATVILPPTSPLEHDHYDLAFNMLTVRNVAKLAKPVFERATDQRHDWEIALELASRLETSDSSLGRTAARFARLVGRSLGPRALLELGLRLGPYGGFLQGGIGVRRLDKLSHGIDLGPLERRFPKRLFTEDSKIALAPKPYLDDIERLERAIDSNDTGLVLIGRRDLRSDNSWLHNSPRLVKGKPRCTLLIHPDDARERDLAAGDVAKISSRVGTLEVVVNISDEVMRGVVSLPHGWGHGRPGVRLSIASENAGVSANDLTDELHVDRLSGNSGFNGVPVEVAAL